MEGECGLKNRPKIRMDSRKLLETVLDRCTTTNYHGVESHQLRFNYDRMSKSVCEPYAERKTEIAICLSDLHRSNLISSAALLQSGPSIESTLAALSVAPGMPWNWSQKPIGRLRKASPTTRQQDHCKFIFQ